MAHWLLKTEPSSYSFDALLADGRTRWDGIENAAALKHLRSAAVGDDLVIYHTGDERRAVGLAVIARAAYVDPASPEHLPVIDVEARGALPEPVSLATIKADPVFEGSPLVKQGRLSFVPLADEQWARLLVLGKKRGKR